MAILVLRSWKVGQTPVDKENNYISIVGRQAGLISFFLTMVGMAPTSAIKMGANRMEYVTSSLSGTDRRIIPLENICSTYFGYYRPIWPAVCIFVVFIVLSYFAISSMREFEVNSGWVALTLVAGVLFTLIIPIVYYFLNRAFTLGVAETSGVTSGIRFKRSVIEGEDVEETKTAFASELMQALIEAKHCRYMPGSMMSRNGSAER